MRRFWWIAGAIALQACSPRVIALRTTASLLDRGSQAFYEEPDPELATLLGEVAARQVHGQVLLQRLHQLERRQGVRAGDVVRDLREVPDRRHAATSRSSTAARRSLIVDSIEARSTAVFQEESTAIIYHGGSC